MAYNFEYIPYDQFLKAELLEQKVKAILKL